MSSSPTDLVDAGPADDDLLATGGAQAGGAQAGGVGGSQATNEGQSSVSRLVDVLMPKMGSSVVEGIVVEWQVAVGDVVAADQTLCVISTDKVDSDAPSPASGTVAEVLVDAGETVDVGTVIARLAVGDGAVAGDGMGVVGGADAVGGGGVVDDRGPADGTGSTVGGAGGVAADGVVLADADTPPAPGLTRDTATPRTRRETLRRSSPVAAKIAAEHGIDVLGLVGSGRNGRVTKSDVLREVERRATAVPEPPMHIETPYRRDPATPVAGAPGGAVAAPGSVSTSARQTSPTRHAPTPGARDEGTVVPLDRMRTAIGAQMRKALDTAAHATTIVECDMSRIERQRRELGVTALPLVARHVLDALREFPALNATFDGDTLTRFDRVHLGVAVSLGEDGLIVPVIHDAQDLSAEGIAQRVRDVAGRARSGELSPDEVRGGTFTITNPGAAGALVATPIINVPQVAILDLEAIVKRPVVVTDADGQDSIAIRPMTHLCMSWDHRVLDGMYAARFLTALRRRIEGR